MTENRVVSLRPEGAIDDPLTEILRAGARSLIAQAVEAEFAAFLGSHEDKALPDGRFEVTLKVAAKKLKADALGKETDSPLHDWIDIGVLDADGKALYLEKKKIEQEEATFTLVVPTKPAKAGIDPFNTLIDRRPKDNAIPVEIE